jgi:hypothetical protein
VADVALAAQGALEHYRRVQEIESMGQPSLTWETTVTAEVATESQDTSSSNAEFKDDPT